MIKVEHIETFNWEGAIRGMRNPLNSHDKSDSHICFGAGSEHCGYMEKCGGNCCYEIGKNDLALARKLCRAGSDHRKFLRQIFVSMDITAPLYWWKEFSTYKVGTVANSCSTMHTIHKKPFELDDFSIEHLSLKNYTRFVNTTFVWLNEARDDYLRTNDKADWWQMIQLLPTTYNQKRTVTLNYEVLLNMYHARCNHRLDEWRTFCEVIETMPYAKELICNVD